MVKATQPPHRCLTHLILLIVRTIEATLQRLAKANADAAGDLQISKKEMMKVFRWRDKVVLLPLYVREI